MNFFVFDIFTFLVFLFAFSIAYQTNDDALFLEFVKKLPEDAKLDDKMEIVNPVLRQINAEISKRSFKDADFEAIEAKINVHFQDAIYQTHLGVLFLMVKEGNWKCDKNEVNPYGKECKYYREYVLVLYEYLFRVYLQEVQLPAVKPSFEFERGRVKNFATLIDAVTSLSMISDFLFNPIARKQFGNDFESIFMSWPKPTLANRVELEENGYQIKLEEEKEKEEWTTTSARGQKGEKEGEEKGKIGQKGEKEGEKEGKIGQKGKEKEGEEKGKIGQKGKEKEGEEKGKIGQKAEGKEEARQKGKSRTPAEIETAKKEFDQIMETMSEIAQEIKQKVGRDCPGGIWLSPFLPKKLYDGFLC